MFSKRSDKVFNEVVKLLILLMRLNVLVIINIVNIESSIESLYGIGLD